MGATIVISLRTQLRISVSRSRILLKCFQRAVILILLGLIVNSQHGNSLATLRFPGVLQLLAISYLLCAALETLFMNAQRTFQVFIFIFLQIKNNFVRLTTWFCSTDRKICLSARHHWKLGPVANNLGFDGDTRYNHFCTASSRLPTRISWTRRLRW